MSRQSCFHSLSSTGWKRKKLTNNLLTLKNIKWLSQHQLFFYKSVFRSSTHDALALKEIFESVNYLVRSEITSQQDFFFLLIEIK